MAAILVAFYAAHHGSLFDLAGQGISSVGVVMVTTWLMAAFATLFGGKGGFADTLIVVTWTGVPGLIGAPFAACTDLQWVSLLISVWSFVLMVVAIKEAHGISGLKSLGTILISGAIFVLFVLLIGKIVGKAMSPTVLERAPTMVMSLIPASLVSCWIGVVGLIAGSIALLRAKDTPSRLLGPVLGVITVAGIASTLVVTCFTIKLNPLREVGYGAEAYLAADPDFRKAAGHFRAALGCYPDDTKVRLYLAHSLVGSGDTKSGLAEYARLGDPRQGGPEVYEQRLGIGTAHYLAGDLKSAVRELSADMGAWSISSEAQARLALIYLRKGELDQAASEAKSAINGYGSGYLPHVVLAAVYAAKGDTAKRDSEAAKVAQINQSAAERLASGPGGWKTAAERVGAIDLRIPLDPLGAFIRQMTGGRQF
jgi:hypothetical protein